jgi:hypothetical protein
MTEQETHNHAIFHRYTCQDDLLRFISRSRELGPLNASEARCPRWSRPTHIRGRAKKQATPTCEHWQRELSLTVQTSASDRVPTVANRPRGDSREPMKPAYRPTGCQPDALIRQVRHRFELLALHIEHPARTSRSSASESRSLLASSWNQRWQAQDLNLNVNMGG